MAITLVNSKSETIQDKFLTFRARWTTTISSLENQIGRLESLFKWGSFAINKSTADRLKNLKKAYIKLDLHAQRQIDDLQTKMLLPLYDTNRALDIANLKLGAEIDDLVTKTYSFKISIFDIKNHCKKL